MGSVRFTERHVHGDPPEREELAALAEDARGVVEPEVPADIRARVEQGIGVAGTATTLAAIDLELDPYDAEQVHGYPAWRPRRLRAHRGQAGRPHRRRAPRSRGGLHPDRAPDRGRHGDPAGIVRVFDLDEIEVSSPTSWTAPRSPPRRPTTAARVRRAWLDPLALLAGCADDPESRRQVTVPARDDRASQRPHRPDHRRRGCPRRDRPTAREAAQRRWSSTRFAARRAAPHAGPPPWRAIATAMGARLRCARAVGRGDQRQRPRGGHPHLRFRWAFQ